MKKLKPFSLPFVGKNFFRGIVLNSELPFGKDAAYGGRLPLCDHGHRPEVCFLVKEQIGDRLNSIPKVEL